MIKRELYMSRIRPFIGGELIKVMTGIRRSGKSVMLDLIKEELVESGIDSAQFISINFEDMRYACATLRCCMRKYCTVPKQFKAKSICSLMKSKRLRTGKSALTLCALRWIVTSISQVPMPNCYPVNWQPTWADGM